MQPNRNSADEKQVKSRKQSCESFPRNVNVTNESPRYIIQFRSCSEQNIVANEIFINGLMEYFVSAGLEPGKVRGPAEY